MSEHTPGPWRAIKFDECQTSIVADLDKKRHPLIAIVSVGDGRPDSDGNVDLIVSAPTLFIENQALRDEVARLQGALERIVKYGDKGIHGNDGICPYGCDTPHIAKAALTPQGGKGGAE